MNTTSGIQVKVPTTEYHRKLTSYLREKKIPYYTYALEEERLLRVVIRRVPREIPTTDVVESLKAQNYPVREVHRMYHHITKATFDMVLVILDRTREGKDIFNLKYVCGLYRISVEPPRKSQYPSQCHNCQSYGHSARNCHLRPRCVKCTEDHSTNECKRTRDSPDPPSCVLCGEMGHPANYRGCPRAPRTRRPRQARQFIPQSVQLDSAVRPQPLLTPEAFPNLPSASRAPMATATASRAPIQPVRTPLAPWAPLTKPQPHKAQEPSVSGNDFGIDWMAKLLLVHDIQEIIAFDNCRLEFGPFQSIKSFPNVAATLQRLARAPVNK